MSYFNYSCNQVWFTLLPFYIRGNQEFTILDNFLQGHIARKWWRYYLPLKIILSLRGEGRKIQGILTWDLFFLSNKEYEVVRQEKTSYGKMKKTWRKDFFFKWTNMRHRKGSWLGPSKWIAQQRQGPAKIGTHQFVMEQISTII